MMTEKQAWEWVLGRCDYLVQHTCVVWCSDGFGGEAAGLCALIVTLNEHDMINTHTLLTMADTISGVEPDPNAPMEYKWSISQSGWEQRKEFCRQQIQRLSQEELVDRESPGKGG